MCSSANRLAQPSSSVLSQVNTQICANITGDVCNNGQAAFYYSQGCFIGCAECDHKSGRRQTDLCGLGKKDTLPAAARSLNRNATIGSENDIYRHNPWRSPGAAPVGDKQHNGACGLAGGTPWGPDVGEAGDYTNTSFAHHGTIGVTLPPMPTGVVWKRGGEGEVTVSAATAL